MVDNGASAKLKLFVSYSRRDTAFADRLADALTARGFHVRIDRRDLPKLEDWERELLGLVLSSDTVILVLSRNSLVSEIVQWEMKQVDLYGKRLAPVVIANLENLDIPRQISKINYIFFTDDSLFEQRADELARALKTDGAWLREHTRINELAWRWIELGKPDDPLIRGDELTKAAEWAARRPRDAPAVTESQVQFLSASETAQTRQLTTRRRLKTALGLVLGCGFLYLIWLIEFYVGVYAGFAMDIVRPQTLMPATERALKPGNVFKECSACPEMAVVPPGTFLMGSTMKDEEKPPHRVLIEKAFAVSRFEVKFDEWDACVVLRGCAYRPGDEGWGRGTRPVIGVSWDDVQRYVRWLSQRTGKPYRMLSEVEWEYSARAGSDKAYYWGDSIGHGLANCNGCGSEWDNTRTAPVGSFAPNIFGISDIHGNVWEWVADCWHDNYRGAPTDGSVWAYACTDAGKHVVRGGGWNDIPDDLRASARYGGPTTIRNAINGIRLARTLAP